MVQILCGLPGWDFLGCDVAKALDIINVLSSFFVYDHGVDAIIDRLDIIETNIDTLN